MADDQIKFTVQRTFAVLASSLDDALEQTKPKGENVECVAVQAGPFQAPPTRPQPPTVSQFRPGASPVSGAGQTPVASVLPTQNK